MTSTARLARVGTFRRLLPQDPRETSEHTTYLADTRDLVLREAETRQLAVTAAPADGTRRAILRAVAGRAGRAGRVSALHRAARRRVTGQGRGRALGAVIAGSGAQDFRATAATAGRRRTHRAPAVTSGAPVGHHGCGVISGVHHDHPPHRRTAALHRGDASVLPASRVRRRPRDPDPTATLLVGG